MCRTNLFLSDDRLRRDDATDKKSGHEVQQVRIFVRHRRLLTAARRFHYGLMNRLNLAY